MTFYKNFQQQRIHWYMEKSEEPWSKKNRDLFKSQSSIYTDMISKKQSLLLNAVQNPTLHSVLNLAPPQHNRQDLVHSSLGISLKKIK